MEKTIEIPEGYEARIDGNKVIIEPKESADERIRKEIIQYLKDYLNLPNGNYCRDDFFAWLERQGEHIKFLGSIQIGDEVTRNPDGVLINLSQFKRKAKQGEQNLANSAKTCKDEQNPVIEMKSAEESLGIDSKTYNKIVDECIYGEQNPAWSEEDYARIDELISLLEDAKPYLEKNNNFPDVKLSLVKEWLKSLRPQNQWKPSEEQINGIECAIKTLQYQLNVGDKRLNSLYEQLKKLKG